MALGPGQPPPPRSAQGRQPAGRGQPRAAPEGAGRLCPPQPGAPGRLLLRGLGRLRTYLRGSGSSSSSAPASPARSLAALPGLQQLLPAMASRPGLGRSGGVPGRGGGREGGEAAPEGGPRRRCQGLSGPEEGGGARGALSQVPPPPSSSSSSCKSRFPRKRSQDSGRPRAIRSSRRRDGSAAGGPASWRTTPPPTPALDAAAAGRGGPGRSVVNAQLRPLSMEVRKGLAEEDGRTYHALVNLAETEVTKMASDYSENELELFKKTMDLIMLSESGLASSTEILNSADQLKPKKMKKREAEQVLQNLVQDQWLSEKEGEYALHPRCILELEQYILRHYPGTARKCHICHSLSVQSQVCETCGIGMHLPCSAKYFQAQTAPRCPQCKQFWPHRIPARPQQPASSPRESRRTSSVGTRQR
ncbi:non-structural maintenance of chromosomes element 1 homolog isoform X1 [Hemicordylus capensis]|uniref:non-structural maintenance of chromosomes element 1 homolog isoform X1 n=1 Tax=Hemicordylus capensis TaxID=884348 RepID=UPI002303C518|nr:non-structural maintenance of chromosomes element 1 homolog isoform X1 [Hemicordylus capensis]